MSHAITGLVNGKNGSVGPRQGPTCTTTLFKPRRRCWADNSVETNPTLLLPVPLKKDGGPGPIPAPMPDLGINAIRASNSRMVRFRLGKPCRCRHRRP